MSHSTYAEARVALERNETSCLQLVSSFLSKIEARNPLLNAFLSVDAEGASARARELDAERTAGKYRPLTGLVLGVKDVICTRDEQTSCGSRMLDGFRSTFDATAVARLREAGAIVIGKLNCDEFAMGSSNENSAFGPVRNPVHPDYVPGGSSGGSAAAVAAGLCHAALGTDTGGSIRQPAAFCGVVGLKPTYGRVSRLGLVAYASSFDCMGPLTRSVEEAARILQVMAGHDAWDSTSADVDVPDYAALLDRPVAGLKVGLPKEYLGEGLDGAIRARLNDAVEGLSRLGVESVEVSLPHTRYGIATYYVLATAEASSNLARYDGVRYGHRADPAAVRAALTAHRERLESALSEAVGRGDDASQRLLQAEIDDLGSPLDGFYSRTRSEGFGPEVKRRIMLGTYVLSSGYYDAYYRKAQKVRTLIRRDFEQAFSKVDLLLTPATPTPAFPLGSKVDDPIAMYLSDIYTVTANLAGIPGLVTPSGLHPDAPHLPIGLQLLAPHFQEARLLRVGAALHALFPSKNG
jgi:aspartyl-tRNA(Asn)/glutamyl-tRNA(Gln) amidotransferase subunit A